MTLIADRLQRFNVSGGAATRFADLYMTTGIGVNGVISWAALPGGDLVLREPDKRTRKWDSGGQAL